jgi:hypothetical protein
LYEPGYPDAAITTVAADWLDHSTLAVASVPSTHAFMIK